MLSSLLSLAHVVGIALGVGGATAKLVLLVKTRVDHAFVPGYLKAARSLTRMILVGIILLTLSGISWLVLGYPLTSRLVTKLVLVAAIWMIGPIISKVAEPRFRERALTPEAPATPAFVRARTQYLALEVTATLLFYAVVIYWLV
jgi:uncharacterized membrane protein